MPNPNYSYPTNADDELIRWLDKRLNPKQPVPKVEKIQKIRIKLPDIRGLKPQSLNDVADEVLGNSKTKTTNEKDQERLDAIYNNMLDRQDASDMQDLIDELIEEERRKDDLTAREVLDSFLQKKSCSCCGGIVVTIRGRYPKDAKRIVCPTCMADRLDTIREIADPCYGLGHSEKK